MSPRELLRIMSTDVRGTLRLVGELDVSNVERVHAQLGEELVACQQLTLDASGLTFMDSQGLRMLIGLGERAGARGWSVRLLNCSKGVRRTLDVAVPQGIPGVEVIDPET
jgi:anti-anti-sigma factor